MQKRYKVALTVPLMLLAVLAFGATPDGKKDTVRVYEVNKYGQTQYHKPSLKVQGDKAYQVDKYGNTQYHRGTLKLKKK